MLFSREDVSSFINQHFEPSWEMVRPVPIIRIDFGNNNVMTRTLHGNVASYVCRPDGQLVDILPGIYTPQAYTTALQVPRDFVRTLEWTAAERRQASLRVYHRQRAEQIRNVETRRVVELDRGKLTIERRLDNVVNPAAQNGQPPTATRPRTAAELASWQPLVADTQVNETQRRLQIHTRLTTADAMRPEQITRWLYREVLHADLDDPQLGLGEDFFAEIER